MKSTEKNWIKLNRSLVDNPLWKIKPFSKGQAWVDLLMLSNHSKGFITVKNGKLIEVNRGECGYSILGLADRWGWSRGKINRFFDTLTTQEMIQQKIVENHTIISVLNYNTYQSNTTNDTTNSTTNGQQTVQQTDTNKNNKNEENENKFNEFWNLYPRKKEKKKAKKEYFKLISKHNEIITGLKKYINDINKNKTEEKHIKYPTTWLNGECWDDEYETNNSVSKSVQRIRELEAMGNV